MAGIYNGPARGGTRGGKDQFNWEDVKEDKQGQNYLGHSVQAAHGRWQKNKDLNWAWKKSKLDLKAANKTELQMAKERDADLMAQMLGEKPMQRPEAELARTEKNKLFKKGNAEEGTVAEAIAGDKFGERIEGLGFAPIKIDNLREMLETTTHEKQEGFASDLLKAHTAPDGEIDGDISRGGDHEADGIDYAALLAGIEGDGNIGSPDKKSQKDMKKALKEEKKRLKAQKKESKLHKKEKRGKKERSSSDSEEFKKPRQLELEHRHHEWAGAGDASGMKRDRSMSPSRPNDRKQSYNHSLDSDRHRDQNREHYKERDKGREPDRDRDRDRNRHRDRDRDLRKDRSRSRSR